MLINRLSILSLITSYKSIPTTSFTLNQITAPTKLLRRNTFVSSLFLLGNSFHPTFATNQSFCAKSSIETKDFKMITGYLNAGDAASLDIELMNQPGFSLEQLMELAGLSVAEAVYHVIQPKKKILVVCGPGNNGGDGLVAARHLIHFGHDCVVIYPKPSKGQHFTNLVAQLHNVDVPILPQMPDELSSYDAVIDALFGFSFKGPPREPLASCLNSIMSMQKEFSTKVISVDVPSGWNVNEGDVDGMGFVPDVLVSLTAPKLCVKKFGGLHSVGGRFLPDKLADKYNIKVRNLCIFC